MNDRGDMTRKGHVGKRVYEEGQGMDDANRVWGDDLAPTLHMGHRSWVVLEDGWDKERRGWWVDKEQTLRLDGAMHRCLVGARKGLEAILSWEGWRGEGDIAAGRIATDGDDPGDYLNALTDVTTHLMHLAPHPYDHPQDFIITDGILTAIANATHEWPDDDHDHYGFNLDAWLADQPEDVNAYMAQGWMRRTYDGFVMSADMEGPDDIVALWKAEA